MLRVASRCFRNPGRLHRPHLPGQELFSYGRGSGRMFVRMVTDQAGALSLSQKVMQRRTCRFLIKFAGLNLGILIGAACVVPEPFTVLHGLYRFASCFAVTSLIAADYKYSLYKLEGEKYAKALHTVHERSAKRLLALFQYNKGIFIKFGQHLAALDYLLPNEYTSAMSVLQSAAPHTDFKNLETIFQQEYGKLPKELFDEFDEKPIAAASLAQVHVARKDGKKYAVKIQFPGLRETCAGDSLTIQILLGIMTKMFSEFKFGWLIKEINLNLPKELNFMQEGLNADLVRNNFKNQRNVVVPEINWDMTNSRVLVMEFCEGVQINNIQRIKEQNIKCEEVAKEVTRIFDKMAFEDGFIHCDPHPGNLLVRPRESLPEDGKFRRFLRWSGIDKSKPFEVVLLDHGLYRNLEEDNFKEDYLKLWNAIINFDEKTIEETAEKMGAAAGYRIFCSILTSKTWDKLSDKSNLSSAVDSEELERIAAHAQNFLKEIMYTLQSVKPELLLLFKTNDLLRSLHRLLGSNVNTYLITSKTVDKLVCQQALRENPSVWNHVKVYTHRAVFLTKISLYELYISFKNK